MKGGREKEGEGGEKEEKVRGKMGLGAMVCHSHDICMCYNQGVLWMKDMHMPRTSEH